MYRTIDLFSGCGGLSLGFERAGFDVVQAYDNWGPAVATYRSNFDHPIDDCDLVGINELPTCDLIVGGPPCQGFSSAGLRREFDERNSLVGLFADLVARTLPRAFVFENVEGFVTAEAGKYVFDLLVPLVRAGYKIHLRKVNVSHFGVPQHRKRVLAIGGLGWEPEFPTETHATYGAPGTHLANKQGMPFAPTVAEALAGLPNSVPRARGDKDDGFSHSYSPFSDGDLLRASHLQQGQRMRDLPEELWHDSYKRRAYRRVRDGTPTEKRGGAPSGLRRLVGDEPSKAITGGALRDFVHPFEDRPLTIRECARLQSFPDEFLFEGTVGEKCQQIGNAVPPHFAHVVAGSLIDQMQSARRSHNTGELVSFVPTYSQGMSPILKKVCDRVQSEFAPRDHKVQGELCL
ncbi:DNA cytosine methyltransferase [Ruegeria atlantica]|uniref:Cytosine-specific methyltransferase n=1 Tax=Ruegeria atlantica TaxID=81569 RepID=A0ABX1WHZ2_9RHOB|nr:DNA (cytosine-5-)-methyltransferase [Ruegeria atlantica]